VAAPPTDRCFSAHPITMQRDILHAQHGQKVSSHISVYPGRTTRSTEVGKQSKHERRRAAGDSAPDQTSALTFALARKVEDAVALRIGERTAALVDDSERVDGMPRRTRHAPELDTRSVWVSAHEGVTQAAQVDLHGHLRTCAATTCTLAKETLAQCAVALAPISLDFHMVELRNVRFFLNERDLWCAIHLAL
jgi:hypothetical protein